MVSVLAGCFDPHPPSGVACPDGVCPSPLACSAITHTCEAPGGEPGDAPRRDGPTDDAAPSTDAPPADAANLPTFAELSGQQWLMPCDGPLAGSLCPTHDVMSQVVVGGDPNQTYTVTVRIRGLMERGVYAGGTAQGAWYVGGDTTSTFLTVAKLAVSAPAQHYFLNNVASGGEQTFDYQVSFPLTGGATVTLSMSALDGQEVATSTTVIAGVTTTPSPYPGQFAQLDVIAVAP